MKKTEKKEEKWPHAYIATPAYDGKVDTDFCQSLANATWHCGVYGIQCTVATMGNGAFIDLARNMFVKLFLKENKDCTHFLFIDSDLKFEVRAMVEVIRHCTEDRPVVAAAYRRRQDPEDYPLRWMPHPELSKDGIDKLWFDEQGFLMCDRVATGFLCIRREILEEMNKDVLKMDIKGQGKTPRLFYTYLDDKNRFVGEDFAWCDDYMKKYNKPISVWPDFDFVHGGYEGNYLKWLEEHAVNITDGEGGTALPKEEQPEPTRRKVVG